MPIGSEEQFKELARTFEVGGVSITDTFDEIKRFAFKSFTDLDRNEDGFLSADELKEAFESNKFDLRQRAFISFLLRRIADIESTYSEEWAPHKRGISLVDLQEYFAAD